MKQYVGWSLLLVCLVATYQGWQTSKGVADTQDRARAVACDIGEECVISHEQPRAVKADFMARKYEFKTSVGPATVTCKREYVFFGSFSCTSSIGSIGAT